jgi:putative hydrolase of the HAD superfamily
VRYGADVERSPVIVFDLGGVLVPPEGSISALAAALDVPRETFALAYWRVRDDYDRGGPSEVFWSSILTELRRTADPRDLDGIDVERWSHPAPGIAGFLADLVDAGLRLTVLSNAPASLAVVVRASSWSTVFSHLVFSSDVGVMKPEPAVYDLAEKTFGVPGQHLVFFDDRPVNVEGARRAGWQAHLWTDLAAARRTLVEAGHLRG